MFQVESRAQMSCLPRLRPVRFYDVVVQVAIIRPGPIVGQMVNPFLQRRQGKEEVTYAHPSLEPVLKRTLGVPLFQEQLLRIAMIAANFTGGEAEDLRRAMGFKRSQARMKEIEAKLRSGMTANGISTKAQEEIILSITSFALYGFPESHAASFALIAYASAYLKCHYLAAFTAALLNNQPMGFYSPATIVKDAQRHGLKLLPVDVTKSDWNCTLEPVLSSQFSVLGEVVSRRSSVVGPGDFEDPAAERRQNAAHGASRGSAEEMENQSPEGRKKTTKESNEREPTDSHENSKDQRPTTNAPSPALRMGLRYVRGLREEAARSLILERTISPFKSIHDFTRRVPELRKPELTTLAEIGALNAVASDQWSGASKNFVIPTPVQTRGAEESQLGSQLGTRNSQLHRRDALWQSRTRRPSLWPVTRIPT